MHRSSTRGSVRLALGLVIALALGLFSSLGPVAPTGRAEASVTVSSDRQELASTLVAAAAAGTFRVTSPGFVDRMIAPVARGQEPAAGCSLTTSVLQTLVLTQQRFGSIHISSLARACPGVPNGPSCQIDSGSLHCTSPSRAIDFVGAGGVVLRGGAESIPLLQFLDTFVPVGSRAGQIGCGSSVALRAINFRFADTCNHLHVDLPDVLVTGSIPAGGVLLQTYGTTAGWQTANTGLVIPATRFSGVRVGSSGWPQVMANENGVLMQIAAMPGWTKLNTGLGIGNGSPLSAVDMGGGWPQVMVNADGALLQIFANSAGWHRMDTGVRITPGSAVSAVRVSGGWPQIMVNDGGRLLQIAVMGGRWTALDTGVRLPAGAPLSAVYQGGNWPQAMVNADGALLQVHADNRGWHVGNTGVRVSAGSQISAVNKGGNWPQVVANDNGALLQIVVSGGAWTRFDTGRTARPGTGVSAVEMGGPWPQILTAG